MQLIQPDRCSRHVTEYRLIQALDLIMHVESLQHHIFHSHDFNDSQQGDPFQMRSALQIKTPA